MLFRYRLDRKRTIRAVLALGFTTLLLLWTHPNWIDRYAHRVLNFDTDIGVNRLAKTSLCKQHGWNPYYANRKVYDMVMVNTELDWLEIRLNTTYDFVDYFIIVESPKTFTNHDKPLLIKENLDKFAAYRDKIIYHELQIPEGFHSDAANPAWAWEELQRDAMYEQVLLKLEGPQAPGWGDVIIVADVDEIIRPQTLMVLKACNFPRRVNLRSSFYYYSFQNLHTGVQWQHPQATYYEGWQTVKPSNLRESGGGLSALIHLETVDLWDAGWHCSSCFATMQEFLTKMASFSHTWMNQEKYRDRKLIADHVREGKDVWERSQDQFTRVENNMDVPPLLLHEPERFHYMLDRDGPSAGFEDYP